MNIKINITPEQLNAEIIQSKKDYVESRLGHLLAIIRHSYSNYDSVYPMIGYEKANDQLLKEYLRLFPNPKAQANIRVWLFKKIK